MFQECTIIAKINEAAEMPIDKVIGERPPLVYAFSRGGNKLRSKFNVCFLDQGETYCRD